MSAAVSSATHADGRVPIVIGVTGHRDLAAADGAAHRERVTELLAEFRRRYPTTPLRVLSPLAAGADRLVAAAALDAGCEVVVPLPLPPAEYERDFPDSVDEFRAILARIPPERVFVLPFAPGNDAGSIRTAESRDRQYRAVGTYIAEHSHVLVALWDGRPSHSDAGTAAVVRYKLEGDEAAPVSVLDPEDTGPVFHLQTSRTGKPATAPRASWLFPTDHDGEAFDAIGRAIERFNADPARARVQAEFEASARSLLPESAPELAPDRDLATTFAAADRLAAHYQRITHRVLRAMLLLAGSLALIFEVYAHIVPWRILPIAYLAAFGGISVLYAWQRRVDAQRRYLDYRALAEGLRVQFYWRLAGLNDTVAANYLRRQLDELRWIREALRGVCPVPRSAPPRVDLVIRDWVAGQARYYRTKTESQSHRIHRIETWSWAFFSIGLAAAAVVVVAWTPLRRHHEWHHALVLVMGFAPVLAALWEAFSEKFALRTQANQFARFAAIFGRADRWFAARAGGGAAPSGTGRDAEIALLRELGRESLMENGDWVLLFRDRPIVLAKG